MSHERSDQTAAWRELHDHLVEESGQRRAPAGRPGRRRAGLRDLAAPLVVLMLLVVPVVIAAPGDGDDGGDEVGAARGEGRPIDLGERNPSSGGSQRETAVIADVGNSGLVLRPSNTAKGGRAISATCDNDGTAPEDGCAVYVNKGQGAAASFRTAGSVPFAIRDTNNGLVEHLNADRLDNLHANEIIGQARAKNGLDADTLDGLDPGDIVGQARAKNGLDADTLDGQNSSDFLGKTETAADSSKVDGFDANSLIRAASAEDDLDALVNADGQILTTSIETPTSGFLLITASADAFATATTADPLVECSLELGDTELKESERQMELNDPEGNGEENCATHGTESVSAGTHKVDFVGSSLSPGIRFDEAVLHVLFVPFGATGAQP